MRARLAILLAQQTVMLRAIVMTNKPAEMLTMSPKGTVPVLILANSDDVNNSSLRQFFGEEVRVLDREEFGGLELYKRYNETSGSGQAVIHHFVVGVYEILLFVDRHLKGKRVWESMTLQMFNEQYELKGNKKKGRTK